MKLNRILHISAAIELMGLKNEDTDLPNPHEMARRGASADAVEWAKQRAMACKMAALVATNTACRSNFVSLSFIAKPASGYPSMDFDWKQDEAWMCVGDGRIFTFDRSTNKVTGFDTEECVPGFVEADYVCPVSLWQVTDNEKRRIANCLN